MKAIARQVLMTLLFGLIWLASNAQITGDLVTGKKAFEINLFMGKQEKINLMLAVKEPKKVTIQLKDANDAVLYQESLSRVPASHWRKFDFEGMKTGVYYLEISNGQQKIVRRFTSFGVDRRYTI